MKNTLNEMFQKICGVQLNITEDIDYIERYKIYSQNMNYPKVTLEEYTKGHKTIHKKLTELGVKFDRTGQPIWGKK